MAAGSARLVVFAGLPGCGKTTLARAVADELGATFLRIDTFEAAIVSTLAPFENNPVGYVAASWVAEDQLCGHDPRRTPPGLSLESAAPARMRGISVGARRGRAPRTWCAAVKAVSS
ncbi:AAA family ATPase [Nocardia sp. NPDC050193]